MKRKKTGRKRMNTRTGNGRRSCKCKRKRNSNSSKRQRQQQRRCCTGLSRAAAAAAAGTKRQQQGMMLKRHSTEVHGKQHSNKLFFLMRSVESFFFWLGGSVHEHSIRFKREPIIWGLFRDCGRFNSSKNEHFGKPLRISSALLIQIWLIQVAPNTRLFHV